MEADHGAPREGSIIKPNKARKRSSRPWLFLVLGIVLVVGFSVDARQNQTTVRHPSPVASPRTVNQPTKARAAKAKAKPQLFEPSRAHPLTILSVGDSLGEDLGYGFQDILGSTAHIHLVLDSVGSTGLANVAYYNWPATLARELKQTHPQVMVILIGGNDAVGFDQGNQPVFFGTRLWQKDYSLRVAKMMREATQSGARVFWVGLPIMAKNSVLSNRSMQALNHIYAAQAHIHPGVTYVSSWKLYQNASGQFTEYLKDPDGMTTIVRDTDGVHIAPPAGQELVASAVLGAIDRVDGLHICAQTNDYWPEFNPPSCRNESTSGS